MTWERMTRERAARKCRECTGGAWHWPGSDPFAVLGLGPAAELTDEDVRAAWRRIAAATHPDHVDGGDPVGFALAAASYTELRTSDGRIEARTRLEHGTRSRRLAARTLTWGRRTCDGRTLGARIREAVIAAGWRVRCGRPVRLAARVLAAAGGATLAVLAAGRGPAGPALVTGVVTWLLLTARGDLAAPDDRRSGVPGERGQRGQPGSGPVATGLAGSPVQADQDPT
jgi:hypothetical protein